MNTPQWFHDFNGVVLDPQDIGRRILILSGPSGVGKTTLATNLERECSFFRIVPNCTTRSHRPSDCDCHFKYFEEEAFLEKFRAHEFFLCRVNPPPNYGYLKQDLNDIFRRDKIAVFMFRFSGVDYLRTACADFPAIFIEAEPAEIAKHSLDNDHPPPTKEESAASLAANRMLRGELEAAGHRTLVIWNDYQHTLLNVEQIINIFYQKQESDA